MKPDVTRLAWSGSALESVRCCSGQLGLSGASETSGDRSPLRDCVRFTVAFVRERCDVTGRRQTSAIGDANEFAPVCLRSSVTVFLSPKCWTTRRASLLNFNGQMSHRQMSGE